MEKVEKIGLLVFNLSIGLSLFRLLGLTVRSKWDVIQFKYKRFDFSLFLVSGLALFAFYQSYYFQHLLDWLLLFLLLLFSIEKSIWKYVDAKRNSVLFVVLIFSSLFFQLELATIIGIHFSTIDPLLIIYSGFLNGMVIWFLFSGTELPANAGRYLFYAVFFKAYLYFSKLVITWYANYPSEISWSNLHISPHNYFILLTFGMGIVIPFILFFPYLFKSKKIVKMGLFFLLLSSVFEVIIMYK